MADLADRCAACVRLTRHRGTCTGLPGRPGMGMPICHVSAEGRAEWPYEEREDGSLRVIPGQWRFWRFARLTRENLRPIAGCGLRDGY